MILGNREDSLSNLFYSLFHPSSLFFQTLLRQAHIGTPVFDISLDKLSSTFQETIIKGELVTLPVYFHTRVAFPQFGSQRTSSLNDIHLQVSPIEYFLFYICYSWRYTIERVLSRQSTELSEYASFYTRLIESYLYYLLPCHLEGTLNSPLSDSIFTSTSIQLRGTIDSRNILAATLSDSLLSFIVIIWFNCVENHISSKTCSHSVSPLVNVSIPLSRTILTVVQHLAIIGPLDSIQYHSTIKLYDGKQPTAFISTLKTKSYNLLRKSIYNMIRQSFNQTVYEMNHSLIPHIVDIWLAYIQPWRIQRKFLQLLNSEPQSDDIAIEFDSVNQDWIQFIAENFLFYTLLFQDYCQLCTRHSISLFYSDPRISSSVDRDLINIYRVVCMFSGTENLISLLKEGETLLNQTKNIQFFSKSISMEDLRTSSATILESSSLHMQHEKRVSFTANSTTYLSLLRAGCIQLYGSIEQLPLLFTNGIECIKELVAKLHTAIILLSDEHQIMKEHQKSMYGRILNIFKSILPHSLQRVSDELLAQHETRTRLLEAMRDIFLSMFDICLEDVTLDGIPLPSVGKGRIKRALSIYAEPDLEDESGRFHGYLSETMKKQIRMGMKKCTNRDLVPKKYDTLYQCYRDSDNDDLLTRSYEIDLLVRFSRWFGSLLNELYHRELISFLQRKNYQVPEWALNMRIRLRWLASIPNLVYLTVAILILYNWTW